MYKWMGGLRGGLAVGTTLIATLLGATTGLVATATVTMGLLAYPEMEKRGYDKTIAIGVVLSGGALGLLIPPSITMILVGGLTGLSVGKLFIAGIMPGLLCSFLYCAYVFFRCWLNPALGPALPLAERVSWKEKIISLGKLLPPVAIVLIVLGGIWFGIVTATEAGGIGSVSVLIYAAATGNLTLKNLREAGALTLKVTAMVAWIAIGGGLFTSMNGITGTQAFISNFLASTTASPTIMLMIMVIIVLIMGCFMETLAIAMIALPIMMPIVVNLGIDPFFFGFLFAMDLIVGTISPPFGYTIFYFAGLNHKNVDIKDIYKAGFVFCILTTAALILVVFFPQIALWLPNMMIK
jgi:tripartite ATP-independent transporter DctM subunit